MPVVEPGKIRNVAAVGHRGTGKTSLVEEPGLRRRFGAEYEEYCARVPRWLPRVRL